MHISISNQSFKRVLSSILNTRTQARAHTHTHSFSFVNMKILRTDTTVELKIGDVVKTLGNVCSEITTEDFIYSVFLTATSGVVLIVWQSP